MRLWSRNNQSSPANQAGPLAILEQAIERNNVQNAEVDEPVNAAFAAIKEEFDPHVPQVKAHIAEFRNTPR
jgi:hypothetical protein